MKKTQAEINHAARIVLETLSPGGSEFHNDPYRCAAYIQGIKSSGHEAKCEVVKLKRINAALVEALEGMLKVSPDCLNDILNPCWNAARATKQEYGKHWGGGQACAVCVSKQALAQAKGGA